MCPATQRRGRGIGAKCGQESGHKGHGCDHGDPHSAFHVMLLPGRLSGVVRSGVLLENHSPKSNRPQFSQYTSSSPSRRAKALVGDTATLHSLQTSLSSNVATARPFLRTRSVSYMSRSWDCLLYTSDAADDLLCVDLGGRRII